MSSASLAVEWVPIEKVFLSPANPRVNDPAVEHVAASIRRFSWQQPIVAKRSGEVIAGNTRLKAAKGLGLTTVPGVWFEGTDLDATAYQVADNRTHEFASWDEKTLSQILEHLRAEDALDGVGFSSGEIDDLLAKIEAEVGPGEGEDPGAGELPDVPTPRRGDLWLLEEHRLLCGDSASAEDVDRLLGGAPIHLVNTDPPYGGKVEPRSNKAIAAGLSSFTGTTHHYEPESAVDALRRAVESAETEGRDSFSPVPHLELGALLQDLGRNRMARPYLETAARYPTTRDEALRRLGP